MSGENAAEKRSERRARKAERDAARSLDGLFGGANGGGMADWGDADARWLQAVITTMQTLGGAVTFGLSRDGNAHMLTLLLDGNRKTLWFEPDADLDAELEKVVSQLDTLPRK